MIQNKIDDIDLKFSKMVRCIKEKLTLFKQSLSGIIEDRVHITTGKDTYFANTLSVIYVFIIVIITYLLYWGVFITPEQDVFLNTIHYAYDNFNPLIATPLIMIIGAFFVAFIILLPFILFKAIPITVELFITYLIFIVLLILL